MTIKIFQHGHEKKILSQNKMFHVAQEVIWCQQKPVDVARKSISFLQKQDDPAPKNTLCSKKLSIFLERRAISLIN